MSQVPQPQQYSVRTTPIRIENEPIPMIFLYDIALLLAFALIGFPVVLFAATFYGR